MNDREYTTEHVRKTNEWDKWMDERNRAEKFNGIVYSPHIK